MDKYNVKKSLPQSELRKLPIDRQYLKIEGFEKRSVYKSYLFIKLLEKSLIKRKLLLTHVTLSIQKSFLYVNINYLVLTQKSLKYKSNLIAQKLQVKAITDANRTTTLFRNVFKDYNIEGIKFILRPLNHNIENKVATQLYSKNRRFINSLFQRRFNLFVDFIKLNALISEKQITPHSYLNILCQIFKTLPKRQHNQFFLLIANVFKTLVSRNDFIQGMKLIISGKLKGKARSSTHKILIGKMPTQTHSANIMTSKTHAYTIYGAFGIKLWILFKNKNQAN
jgi:hypothetical protein